MERWAYPFDEARELAGGCSRQHLYNRIKAGDLEVVKFGGKTLITAESLKAALRRGGESGGKSS